MTLMFQRLFQSDLIARSPFHCQCGAIKRRQRVVKIGYMMTINLQRSRQLERLIAENLYDIICGSETPLCSVCGATASAKAEFYKYAYLPEVLMFSTSYIRDGSGKTRGAAWTNVSDAQLTYPEILDMSNLRDDPSREADRNCLYRLQSIVVSPNVATPMSVPGEPLLGVHFKAYLRRNETTWTLLDDLKQDTVEECDIDTIRKSTYRPRLLMYVRVHPSEVPEQKQAKGDTNDNNQRAAAETVSNTQLPGVTMDPFSEDDALEDDSAESSPPKVDESPPQASPPQVKGKLITPPASSPIIQRQSGVKTPAKKDIDTQQKRSKTDITPERGALGLFEGDPNLYPPCKDMPPGLLMKIIRASGVRRDGLGRGSRKLLGGVQRSPRPSVATRLAMSTRAGSRRFQR